MNDLNDRARAGTLPATPSEAGVPINANRRPRNVVPIDGGRTSRAFARGDHVELGSHLRSDLTTRGQVVHVDGVSYQYREPVFAPLEMADASKIVQGFAGCKVGKKVLNIKASDVSGAIRLFQDSVSDPKFFEDAPRGVAFSDSFVEVLPDSIIEHAHSPKNRARFSYSFPFIRDPHPVELLAFFAGVFQGDHDASNKIKCLQEFVGASMLGVATKFQRAIVMVGAGANGKGVATTVIERVMPQGSVTAIAPQNFGHEYQRALLAGKLLNVVAELPEAEILDSEAFKSVIAGDSTTGRHIRQAPFTFRPIAGHIAAANRLPGTADQTHGFWRRWIVLQYNRIFQEHEQDPNLADRIVSKELAHVVSWFLQGGQRLLAQGRYTMPESSADALVAWKRQADQVRISPNVDTQTGHRGHRSRPGRRSVATLGLGAGL